MEGARESSAARGSTESRSSVIHGNNDHTCYDIGKEPLTSQVATDIVNVYRQPGTYIHLLAHLTTDEPMYILFRWKIKWKIGHENLASCLQVLQGLP